MTQTIPRIGLFTMKIDKLAGRAEEEERLRGVLTQLSDPRTGTLMGYITGWGGMGKTRLLQWVSEKAAREFPHLLVTEVIDFYDAQTHAEFDLKEMIVESLHRRYQDSIDAIYSTFAVFRDSMAEFRLTQTGGFPDKNVRNKVNQAFDLAWSTLTKDYGIVILLDTAELLQFQEDEVQRRQAYALPAAASKEWMTTAVRGNLLPRTLLLVAGRPEPIALVAELRSLAESTCTIGLSGLSQAGVDEYFSNLAHELKMLGALEVDSANHFEERHRLAFRRLTDGSPIALSIAIQLYLTDSFEETMPFFKAFQESQEPEAAARMAARAALRNDMIAALREYVVFEDASLPIEHLALMRRGMTTERLQAVWSEMTQSQCESIIRELQKQTFVKTLPGGAAGEDVITLHDEIADWIDEDMQHSRLSMIARDYTHLCDLYQRQVKAQEDLIARLNLQSSALEGMPEQNRVSDEQQRADRMLLEARRNRRQLSVEWLYYLLRLDPLKGYKRYHELAEEAFNVGSPEYDSQIHAEFCRWWYERNTHAQNRHRQQAMQAGIDEAIVNADLAVRWVQRAYNDERIKDREERLRQTVSKANELSTSLIPSPPDALNLTLKLYGNTAQGQFGGSDAEVAAVRKGFVDCITALKNLLGDNASERDDLHVYLTKSGLAFGYYEHAFFKRRIGEYGSAIDDYTRSIQLYRELELEINQARALNDRAYAMVLLGESELAEFSVDDALQLRLRLGFAQPVGLSWNTKGLIAIYNEKPVTAIYCCGRAESIFRRRNYSYGVMLATRALAEAHRRDSARLLDNVNHRRDQLDKARKLADESVALARQETRSDEPIRAEVLDEAGCVYRDLALFYREAHEALPAEIQTAERDVVEQTAESFLEEAVDVIDVGRTAYMSRRVDCEINLAYFYWYVGRKEEAQRQLDTAFGHVPEDYHDLRARFHRDKARARDEYWSHLTKIHGLRLRMAGRELADAIDRGNEEARVGIEHRILDECILIMYFAQLLGDSYVTYRARKVVYDVLKERRSELHLWLYKESVKRCLALGIDTVNSRDATGLLADYIRRAFGAGISD